MIIIQTQGDTIANRAHAAACWASEATRQVAVAAATTQAAARAADIAHYSNCRASGLANGCATEVFVSALRELGTGGS
jgi:ferredoxin